MNRSPKTIVVTVERTIPAPVSEVFDAWLDPSIGGNPWNAGDKYIFDPRIDGLFYWYLRGMSHYGRFTRIERPKQVEHTWVSPSTLGQESTVNVSFKKHGKNTHMTLVHSGLPDNDRGRGHDEGWNYFLGIFSETFGSGAETK